MCFKFKKCLKEVQLGKEAIYWPICSKYLVLGVGRHCANNSSAYFCTHSSDIRKKAIIVFLTYS